MSKTRVLIVDDAAFARNVVARAVRADSALEVVGFAKDGKQALEAIGRLEPDVVTLDLVMPVMGGLEALGEIRRLYPKLPVIVLSALTERGALATLDALSKGATDYVTKPVAGDAAALLATLRDTLVHKIKVICAQDAHVAPLGEASPDRRTRGGAADLELEVVAVAASTGGPVALEELLSELPRAAPVPILIVQHMPQVFTGPWAERLSARTGHRVREIREPAPLVAGDVWVARGGQHMRVRAGSGVVLVEPHDGEPRNSCLPSADVLFESVAEVFAARAAAVVLTGMGSDGLRGSEAVVAAGGVVLAQDRISSVVWGMPGAVVEAGLATAALPPRDIASWLRRAWRRADDEGARGERS